jgi:hypothetical protein
MSKRRIWLLLALVVCVAAALAVAVMVAGSSSSAAAATAGTDPGAPTTNFDATAPYPSVLPVYFISGSPYQMGYQYGQEAKDEIVHNACFVRATALAQYGTWAAVLAAMQTDTAIVAAKTPEVLQVWHGIADGAGLSYDEIRLLNLNPNNIPAPLCSTISAWGAATKDHQLIAGSNGDSTWLGGGIQGCIIVAYPANGNSFIASSPSCGTWDAIRSMNDKDLVLMMSGGQGAQPGDMGPGYPEFNAYAEMIQHCNNATQARDMFLSLGTGKGFINHFVDTSGNAYVVESTSTAHAVRKPGDFGEKDYILATNFYETAKMRPHNDPNQLQDGDLDDWYRYGTEEQLIKQDYGQITVGSMMAILGCHNYYGARNPVTGAVDTTQPQTWHNDVLSLSPASDQGSEWTPGMRAVAFSPTQREIYEPAQKTMYIMTGNDDPLFAWTSNTTGEFCKLVLEDNPGDVTAQALADAQLQTWYGAVALHRTSNPSAARLHELNEAKAAIATGMNLQTQAGLSADPNQTALLLGQATTCFCKAQCYAEQAQGIVSNSGAVPPSS